MCGCVFDVYDLIPLVCQKCCRLPNHLHTLLNTMIPEFHPLHMVMTSGLTLWYSNCLWRSFQNHFLRDMKKRRSPYRWHLRTLRAKKWPADMIRTYALRTQGAPTHKRTHQLLHPQMHSPAIADLIFYHNRSSQVVSKPCFRTRRVNNRMLPPNKEINI